MRSDGGLCGGRARPYLGSHLRSPSAGEMSAQHQDRWRSAGVALLDRGFTRQTGGTSVPARAAASGNTCLASRLVSQVASLVGLWHRRNGREN
ncbi:hypothetical protein DPEC_G00134890 [Dallia pectoralis]|uniref:Uncharacterized protein n=1 Tax=Dallia pectoralis TaxID=75939 RepID=A0ACC2GRV1_DALPE|nr:hypothetical protein DPEC_G00134890 [Dallia pectoralis]